MGRTTASFELARQPRSPEAAIVAFAKLVDGLPRNARAEWTGCKRRVLNIGIVAGVEPYQAVFSLRRRALALAVKMRAEIAFTVYRCRVADIPRTSMRRAPPRLAARSPP